MHYVFLAGIGNSEPEHWQSIWYRRYVPGKATWVEHTDWDAPQRDAWVEDLQRALEAIAGPKLVIAHSLGCLLLGEWAVEHSDDTLAGAFLVAPPDVDERAFPAAARGFRPAAATRLPCPGLIVASQDDPYGSLSYAVNLAGHWQARLIDAGPLGHINLKSDIGEWPQGLEWLQRFERSLAPPK